MTATTVSENLPSTTIYNHGTLSTTDPGAKLTPASYFPYPTDPYNHTMFTDPSKTSTTDSQKINTTPTNSNQHVQSATASSVYRLITVLNEMSKSTIGTEVTTRYSNYTTTSVSRDVSVEQQMTTTQYYKEITSSRSGDIAFSFNSLPLSTSTNMMFQTPLPITASSATPTISTISSALSSSMPFPLATPTPVILMHPKITSEPTIAAIPEYKKITSNRHPLTLVYANTSTISFNLSSTTKQHDYSTYIIGSTKTSNGPQLVTTVPVSDENSTTIHESENGATTKSPTGTEQGTVTDRDPSLFATVMSEKSSQAVKLREAVAWALLSMTLMFLIVLCMHILCRQKRNSKAQTAALYEMADNSRYESSKTSNTLEMNIYESIAD